MRGRCGTISLLQENKIRLPAPSVDLDPTIMRLDNFILFIYFTFGKISLYRSRHS